MHKVLTYSGSPDHVEGLQRIAENWGDSEFWSADEIARCLHEEKSYNLWFVKENLTWQAMLLARMQVDHADLLFVYANADQRKLGLGYRLLEHFEMSCKSREVEKIFLEVRPSNLAALKLYNKKNFKSIDRRSSYYSDGEDALILMKELQA